MAAQKVSHLTDRPGQWPAFDGLRAFAVAAVVLYHFKVVIPFTSGRDAQGGFLGVDVFFVLSGFLITTLLIREHERFGRISLRRFYSRRALRLFPALAVVIVAATVASILLSDRYWSHDTLIGLPWVVLYSGNWSLVYHSGFGTLGLLGPTWSLAVEEQYYLIWPLVLLFVLPKVRSKRHVAAVLAGLAVAEMVARALLMHTFTGSYHVVYFATYTHSDGLLTGSALAFALAVRISPFGQRASAAIQVSGVAAAIGLLALFATTNSLQVDAYRYAICGAVFCSVILTVTVVATPATGLNWLLRSRLALWIGRRSYGIYLWHLVLFTVATSSNRHGFSDRELQLLVIVLTFVIAGISYKIVERPFLNRKARFERRDPVTIAAS